MKIGETIRKYRKQANLTQEQLADYLGVTAPAVNKWENGASLPDISLVAPIARVFGIHTDELLSYKETLTDEEIARIGEEFSKRLMEGDYEALFAWTMKQITDYPNCEKLQAMLLPGLDSFRGILGAEHPAQYDEAIEKAYLRLLGSQDPEMRRMAAYFLFYAYLNREAYDRAEEMLTYVSRWDTEHQKMQALLCVRKGEEAKAWEIYERMILDGYGTIDHAFMGIYSLAHTQGNREHCAFIIEKQEQIARTLEIGKYQEVCLRFLQSVEEKEKETALELLETMIEGLSDLDGFYHSRLYAHLASNDKSKENSGFTEFMFRQGLSKDEGLDFLKDDPRFCKIMGQEVQKD